MPHLRLRGFDEAVLERYAPTLLPGLAELFGCPEDWITLEIATTRFLTKPVQPMIDVVWFPRGQETQDKVARLLHDAAVSWKHPAPVVVFVAVGKADYYEDGKHF